MLRVIEELRPRWVIGENVAGIVNMALDTVLSDLEGIGYTTQAFIIPACAVDAPHRRDRCAIVAYADRKRWNKFEPAGIADEAEPIGWANYERDVSNADRFHGGTWRAESDGQQRQTGFANGGYDVPNPDDRRGPLRWDRELSAVESPGSSGRNHGRGTPEYGTGERRTVKPGLGGVADGIPHWLDEPLNVPRIAQGVKDRVGRLKCLGNAVVPQQFYPIFRAIAELERS